MEALALETPSVDKIVEEGKKTEERAQLVRQESNQLVERALALNVNSPETYEEGFEIIKTSKKAIKAVEGIYKPVKQSIDAHKKDVLDLEKKLKEPFLKAVNLLSPRLDEYDREQERKRREQEARLREEQRKREEEARLAQAVAAEKEGKKEEAEAILEQPTITPAVVMPKSTPKIQGSGFTTTWSAEVYDLMALVKAVAERKVPINALQANTTVLNQQARSLKEHFNWPGVRAVSKRSAFSRG